MVDLADYVGPLGEDGRASQPAGYNAMIGRDKPGEKPPKQNPYKAFRNPHKWWRKEKQLAYKANLNVPESTEPIFWKKLCGIKMTDKRWVYCIVISLAVVVSSIAIGVGAYYGEKNRALTTWRPLKQTDAPMTTHNLWINGTSGCMIDKVNDEAIRCQELKDLPNATEVLHSILYAYMSDNEWTELPDKMFQTLPNLIELDLSNNKIEDISTETFTGLQQLTTLNLSKNNLFTLVDGMFSSLTALTTLLLKLNSIGLVHAEAFSNLKFLKTIDLSNNKIRKLTADMFYDSPNLEQVHFDSNNILNVESNVFRVTSLILLDLRNNLINCSSLRNLPNKIETKHIPEHCKSSRACQNVSCDEKKQCEVIDDVPVCHCKAGYTGSPCSDIDECKHNLCEKSSKCENTPGSYKCVAANGQQTAPAEVNEMVSLEIIGTCIAVAVLLIALIVCRRLKTPRASEMTDIQERHSGKPFTTRKKKRRASRMSRSSSTGSRRKPMLVRKNSRKSGSRKTKHN